MDEEHKITITFNADGSLFYTMDVLGKVYAEQFGMLSWAFKYLATRMKEDTRIEQLVAQEERQQRNKIIPAGGVLKP